MAFDKTSGCSFPSIPEIDVISMCSLPELPDPEAFIPNPVNLPPIPPPPNVDCIDMKVEIKSEDCFGVTISIPGRFGVPSGGDCMDGRYVMSVELPCSMLGPVIAIISDGGGSGGGGGGGGGGGWNDSASVGGGPVRAETAETLDGRKLSGPIWVIPVNQMPRGGGSSSSSKRRRAVVAYPINTKMKTVRAGCCA